MLWQRLLPRFGTAAISALIAAQAHGVRGSESLADDIIDGLNGAADCASCRSLLLSFRATARLGDGALTNALSGICKRLNLQDNDVCDGVFDNVGPVIAHDLRSISPFSQTAAKFCNAVLGLCPEPPVNEYNVPFPKPAPENPKVFQSSGRPPFRVVHFSDVHIDRDYSPDSEANCTKPICCREYEDQSDPTTIPAGPLGDHACDTPQRLAESIVQAIDATDNTFSLFSGDIVDGAVWLVNQEDVTADIDLFSDEFRTALKAPVYPVLGNHESSPVNCFPRNTTGEHADDSQWVFDRTGAQWSPWIGELAAKQLTHHSGSYSVVPNGTNLRVISINSGFWYKMNLWLYDSNDQQPDPNGILSFLVSQLQLAEDLGQRAWIVAHMPPGGADAFHDQSNYYDQVIQRYKHTIASQFFGHTHSDEFQLAYSNYSDRSKDTVTSMAWIAPALTPRSGNPAFKVYDVDPDTYEVMDAKVHSTSLSHPEYQTEPVWSLRYSARELYGSLIPGGIKANESLSPMFWHRVTELFEADDEAFALFQRLKRRAGGGGCWRRRRGDDDDDDGDEDEEYIECKRRAICQLRAQRSQNNCVNVSRGVTWVWGNETASEDADALWNQQNHECEGMSAGLILRQMTYTVSNDLVDETKRTLKMELENIIEEAEARARRESESEMILADDTGGTQQVMHMAS